MASTAKLVSPVLIGAEAVIDAGAVVGPDVVIGDGVRVVAGVSVSSSVVWPGTVVEQSMMRTIATPHRYVHVEDADDPMDAPR